MIKRVTNNAISNFLVQRLPWPSLNAVLPRPHSTSSNNVRSQFLKDTHGRKHTYLRISLAERCNLRCQYCMPEEGVALSSPSALLTADEIVRLGRVFAMAGVDKIRLTGGEPLVRKDIEEIAEELGKISGISTLAITTNGITLAKKLPRLQKAGVNLLNISLDTLDPAKFILITRRQGWEKVMESIQTAIQCGYDPVKINCVVMRGVNDNELVNFVELTRNSPISVRFIEYMPFEGNRWTDKKFVPYTEMIATIKKQFPSFSKCSQQDGPNETAVKYEVPGFRGTVGFISSMSNHFCSSCNRLRITADGNLKVCLFGKEEVSLRDAMRGGASDDQLLETIHAAVLKKKPSHGGSQNLSANLSLQRYTAPLLVLPSNQIPIIARKNTLFSPLWHSKRMHNDAKSNLADKIHASGLSHVDVSCAPTMVNITDKPITKRFAHAQALVQFPEHVLAALLSPSHMPPQQLHATQPQQLHATQPQQLHATQPQQCQVDQPPPQQQFQPQAITEITSAKGPIFSTAIVAGTMAVKQTHHLIPFCHLLPIESCKITIQVLNTTQVAVDCQVVATHKTGVEMEAMVGASVAALTIYDMCKALSHEIAIKDTHLIEKSGGKSHFCK